MSYPMRRYEPAFEEAELGRPAGPVLVEDEPTLPTAPSGARQPPGWLPPGGFATDFDPIPSPFRRSRPPLPQAARPVGRYVSFLPITVAAVYLVLILIMLIGFAAVVRLG